jgi:hypothetical protein
MFNVISRAQDHTYADTKLSASYINPAFTGSIIGLETSSLQRIQWPHQDLNIYSHYTQITYGGGKKKWWYSGSMQHINSGGMIEIDYWSLRTCKQFSPSKNFIFRLALEGSFFKKKINYSNFSFGDEIDPHEGFVYPTSDFFRGGNISNLDFAAGVSFHFFGVTIGLSSHHLTQPNSSLTTGGSPIPSRLGLQASYDLPIALKNSSTLRISPYFWWKKQMFSYWRGGLNAIWNSYYFSYGLSSNQHILGIGYAWKNSIGFRYHFSLYQSTFAKQLLAHEVGFELNLRNAKKERKMNENLKGAF